MRMSLWLSLIAGIGVLAYQVQPSGSQNDGRRLQRCDEIGRTIEPRTELPRAVMILARTCRVRIGFEHAAGQTATVALKTPLRLRTLENPVRVLEAVIGGEGYRVQDKNGTLVVRPVARDGAVPKTFLDTTVTDWSIKDVTLREALDRVIRIFSPGGLRMPNPRLLKLPVVTPSPLSQRIFSLSVRESTVADLLTDIVTVHGEAGWQVTFNTNTGGAFSSNIGFFTFDGSEWASGFEWPRVAP